MTPRPHRRPADPVFPAATAAVRFAVATGFRPAVGTGRAVTDDWDAVGMTFLTRPAGGVEYRFAVHLHQKWVRTVLGGSDPIRGRDIRPPTPADGGRDTPTGTLAAQTTAMGVTTSPPSNAPTDERDVGPTDRFARLREVYELLREVSERETVHRAASGAPAPIPFPDRLRTANSVVGEGNVTDLEFVWRTAKQRDGQPADARRPLVRLEITGDQFVRVRDFLVLNVPRSPVERLVRPGDTPHRFSRTAPDPMPVPRALRVWGGNSAAVGTVPRFVAVTQFPRRISRATAPGQSGGESEPRPEGGGNLGRQPSLGMRLQRGEVTNRMGAPDAPTFGETVRLHLVAFRPVSTVGPAVTAGGVGQPAAGSAGIAGVAGQSAVGFSEVMTRRFLRVDMTDTARQPDPVPMTPRSAAVPAPVSVGAPMPFAQGPVAPPPPVPVGLPPDLAQRLIEQVVRALDQRAMVTRERLGGF